MAAPFSYDLEDLAAYYIAYDRLDAALACHRRGRFHEVIYEAWYAIRQASRNVWSATADWNWDDACLRFERNAAPDGHSRAQPRCASPFISARVGQWRAV